jgi:hypothetical protein
MLARLQNALRYAAAEVAYPGDEANDVNPSIRDRIDTNPSIGECGQPVDQLCRRRRLISHVQVILEGLQFAEDSGNQFRHRRMNVHGLFQHRVRGTRIHHVQDAVDRLIPACTENGCSQDLF